jgi:hypothetical protein
MNSPSTLNQNPNHLGFRAGLALALAAAGLMLGGCATYSPANNLELFARSAPLPTLVAHGKEMATAEAVAAKSDVDFALHGVGSSMEPVYLGGTAIVVHPCGYRTLRPGMAVVYVNRRGNYVAHMLVEEMPKGWFAIGLNNAEPDDDLVTAGNLVGVVKQAYAANDTPFRQDIAARIALRDAVSNHATQVTMK